MKEPSPEKAGEIEAGLSVEGMSHLPVAQLADFALAGAVETSLADQAEGKSRAEIMKQVVGPAFTEFLQTVYTQPLTDDEHRRLSPREDEPWDGLDNLRRFNLIIENILESRVFKPPTNAFFRDAVFENNLSYLRGQQSDIFFHQLPNGIIKEGLESGVVIPLTVASHIYRIEQGGLEHIDFAKFVEIMERPEFDEILLTLTKGPNGFLGSASTELLRHGLSMFDFSIPVSDSPLKTYDAYRVKEGKVVGLSDQYHLSANDRRRRLFYPFKPGQKDRSSSGCPVRHSFEDAGGEKQTPLIITAKQFIVEAIKAGSL
ncbi:MAG TPA: hypothetical protein VD947_00055 [Patescibacteria group bacterium]|nr:hypothetical protein [Patescibacteria group bacterium]